MINEAARLLVARTERAIRLLLDAHDQKMPWPQRCNGCGAFAEHVATCPVLANLVAPVAKLLDDLDAACGEAVGTWRKKDYTRGVSQELRIRYIVRTIYSVEQIPELTT